MPETTNDCLPATMWILFRLGWWFGVVVAISLFVDDSPGYGAACVVGLILGRLIIWRTDKRMRKQRNLTSDYSPPRDQTPMPTISLTVHHSTPPPRPRRPTPPAATTNHLLSQFPLRLSSQLNQPFGFSSPRNASQTRDTSFTGYAPSALLLPGYRGRTDVEAATVLAANQPPPAYPEVVGGDPGLPPPHYTTPATGEGAGKVFEPSNDGLPSYEAAMSTRQPLAYEAPGTPRDDGPTTND